MKLKSLIAGLGVALAAVAAPVAAQDLAPESRRAVVLGAAELIENRYVYADRGASIAHALRTEANGFDHTDPSAFAEALTRRLRELSQDGHFAVEHRRPSSVEAASGAEASHMEAQMERWYGVGVNHGFESVQRLEQGIGYLDLRKFAPPAMGGDLMQAAMTLLAQSPALIIDLRRNGGGMGEMVLMLEAYLLDESTEVSGGYDRPTDRRTRSFTPSWVPGRRFGGEKPVFILISRDTFSAAEAFAYDMQAMGRATIVGQTSGGGAHPFRYRSITPEFVLSLPEGRSINPITGGDWQGVGVRPDVETAPDDALAAALRLAQESLKSGPAASNHHEASRLN